MDLGFYSVLRTTAVLFLTLVTTACAGSGSFKTAAGASPAMGGRSVRFDKAPRGAESFDDGLYGADLRPDGASLSEGFEAMASDEATAAAKKVASNRPVATGGDESAPPATPTSTSPSNPTPTPSKPASGPSSKPASDEVKPLLIYRATYRMAVFEAVKAIDAVQRMALELDGYLVRRADDQITVRVPSEKYRDALARLGPLGDVLSRDETVEDVTDQFMDLSTRLRNYRAVRARVQELLAQAKTVKEALAVERELGRITTAIERIEGRLKLLRELVAFSTITVMFRAQPPESIESQVKLPFPWLDQLGLSRLLDL